MRSSSYTELQHGKPKMAKRSDFAQKLLDDLRLRKERMAASQSSNRSKTTTIDAYAYSKQIHRGSKNTRTHGTGVPKTGNTNMRYSEDNSNQIVPYTRGRNSEQIGDLSMALAFALENGGKLGRNRSSGNSLMLGFLQQIGRRSFEIGKVNKRGGMDRLHSATAANGYFPTISHLHIKEISKGAQKLNQILRTCSNGHNFGRHSIDIGQELLKGAMDLEESLRMLINLHEASEHMISPQQKNRIVLLDDEEDVDENKDEKPDQKQLYQPKFSLDKLSLNSRGSQEVRGNGHKQKLVTLRYSIEGGNFNHEDQPLTHVKLSSHRRSASYGHDAKTFLTPENVGVSNVIAKLMGLDNLPHKSNSMNHDIGFKQKVPQKDLQPTVRGSGSTNKTELKTTVKKSWSNSRNPKPTEAEKYSNVVPTFVQQVINDYPTNETSFQALGIREKPSWKQVEATRPETSPSTITKFKQERYKDDIRQRVASQKDYQEGITRQHHIKHREPKGRDENKGEVLKNVVQQKNNQERNIKQHQPKHREPKATERDEKREVLKIGEQLMETEMHKKSEHATALRGYKERTLHLEKRYPEKLQSRKLQKPTSSPGYQQPLMRKAEIGEIKHHREEKIQKNGKQKVNERNQNQSGTVSKSLTKPAHEALTLPKKQQNMNHVRQSEKSDKETVVTHQYTMLRDNRRGEDLLEKNTRYDLHDKPSAISNKNTELASSSRDSETKSRKEDLRIQPVVEKHHVDEPVKNDDKSTRMQERKEHKDIDEALTSKQKQAHKFHSKRHDKSNVFDEPKLLGANGTKEVEAHIVESKETFASFQPEHGTQVPLKETAQFLTMSCPAEGDSHNFQEPQISAPNNSDIQCEKPIWIHTSNPQDQKSVFSRGEVNSSKIVKNAVEEAGMCNMDVLSPQHLEHFHNFSKPRNQETLTESENHLKQILLTSEWILNAAEALFKLNIPSFILHDSGRNHLKDGRNITIDCSYEVLKRKGVRKELKNHPCTNISMRSNKIGSLDDLIKQLHKDLEALKLYGRNGKIECEVQHYLPKMIESDIYNQEPDLNSMWDLGWNETTFVFLEKEEVVRDVEKHILSGLLDEVSRDLLHV